MSKNPIHWANSSRSYLNEVQVEFKKVTWPTQREAMAGTVSVIVLVALIGLGLYAVDGVLSWGMNALW